MLTPSLTVKLLGLNSLGYAVVPKRTHPRKHKFLWWKFCKVRVMLLYLFYVINTFKLLSWVVSQAVDPLFYVKTLIVRTVMWSQTLHHVEDSWMMLVHFARIRKSELLTTRVSFVPVGDEWYFEILHSFARLRNNIVICDNCMSVRKRKNFVLLRLANRRVWVRLMYGMMGIMLSIKY